MSEMTGQSLEHAETAVEAQELGAPEDTAQQEQPEQKAAAEGEEAEDADIAEQAIEIPTGKVVPVAAVISERKEKRALKLENATLREKAAKADQLEGYIAEMKPVIEFIKTSGVMTARQQEQQDRAAQQQQAQADAEAAEYARDLDLYDAQTGQPDVAKARRILDRNATLSRQAAAQATAPVQEMMESNAVLATCTQLAAEKDADGNVVDTTALNGVLQNLVSTLGQARARAFVAAPGSYNLLKTMVLGEHASKPRKKLPPKPEHDPLVTERSGGGDDRVVVDTRRLHALGVSEEKYKTGAKKYKPGAYNNLED